MTIMPKRKKSTTRSGRATGKVYRTNLVLPDIPEVSLTPEQERRAERAIDALPTSDPNYFRAFRIKIIRQLIHKQDTTESRLTTEEDQRKFNNWMVKIREDLYSQNVPEYAEYLHIVLKQTQEGITHILLLTKCPTSPKKDIPSQDIAMLSYGDNLYNTNTVKFLLKLAEELPNFGNDYGGILGLTGVINLNLNLYCPGAYKTYHGMCGICNSAVSRELEEGDTVTEPVVLSVGNVTNDVTLADPLPPLPPSPPPPPPLPSLPLTTTAAADDTAAVDNLPTDDSAYDSDGSDYSPSDDEEDPLDLYLDDDDDSFIVADSDSDSDSDDDYEPPDIDSSDDEFDFDSDSESEGTVTTNGTLPVNPCEECTDDEEEDQNNAIAEVICLLNEATIDLGGVLAVADLSGTTSKSAKKIWNKPKLKKRLKGVILIGGFGKGKGTYHPSQFCRGKPVVGKTYLESCTMRTKNAMKLSKSVKNFNNQFGKMKDETTHGRLFQKLADDRTFCYIQDPLPSSNITDDRRLFIKRRKRRRTRLSFSCSNEDCYGVTKTEGGKCQRCKWWDKQKQRKEDWEAWRLGELDKISSEGLVMIKRDTRNLEKGRKILARIREEWKSGKQLTEEEMDSIERWQDGSEEGHKIWAGIHEKLASGKQLSDEEKDSIERWKDGHTKGRKTAASIHEKWKSGKQLRDEEMDSIERLTAGSIAGGQAMKEKHDKEAGRTSDTPFLCIYCVKEGVATYAMMPVGEKRYEVGLQKGLPRIDGTGMAWCSECKSRTGKKKHHRQWTIVEKNEEEEVKKGVIPERIKRDLVMCEREGCISKPHPGKSLCKTHSGKR